MLGAGALVVLGGHPHVVQPWEKCKTQDGREAFVIYALGNFVSGQTLTMGASPYTAQLGSGESLALTTKILGTWNQLAKDEPLVTNPECP